MTDFGIDFLGGDFKGRGIYLDKRLVLPLGRGQSYAVHIGCCALDQVTSENSKSMGGAAVAGLAGGALLGPAGLVAGALAGGNKQSVTVAIALDDGRQTVGVMHPRLYSQMVADRITASCVPLPQRQGSVAGAWLLIVGIIAGVAFLANALLRLGG